jgi:hypothetical protein
MFRDLWWRSVFDLFAGYQLGIAYGYQWAMSFKQINLDESHGGALLMDAGTRVLRRQVCKSAIEQDPTMAGLRRWALTPSSRP